MSRENKLKKQKRRRDRRIVPKANELPGELPPDVSAELKRRGLTLLSYNVTYDLLDLPEDKDRSLEMILDLDERERIFDLLNTDPAQAIQPLREHLVRHPGHSTLVQWLGSALRLTGQDEEADRLAEQNYHDHPNYLFARLDYAVVLMGRGEIDKVDEEVLHRSYDLKQMYPERDTFHASEVVAFSGFMVEFWLKRGKFETASIYGDILERTQPEHPLTVRSRKRLAAALLMKTIKRQESGLLRRGIVPGF